MAKEGHGKRHDDPQQGGGRGESGYDAAEVAEQQHGKKRRSDAGDKIAGRIQRSHALKQCDIGNDAGDQEHCRRSEEHTSELQSLMRISYAVFCLKKKKTKINNTKHTPKAHI